MSFPRENRHEPENPGVHWAVVSGAMVPGCHPGGLFVLYLIVASAHGLERSSARTCRDGSLRPESISKPEHPSQNPFLSHLCCLSLYIYIPLGSLVLPTLTRGRQCNRSSLKARWTWV